VNRGLSVSFIRKARYYSSVSVLYVLTLLFAVWVFKLTPLPGQKIVSAINPVVASDAPTVKPLITGKPVRIVIPSQNIDLPVDEGFYNEENNSWTLSAYRAQFARLSNFANDAEGNTFIYGHNNKFVFGPIKNIQQSDQAVVYTDNNHTFYYEFENTYAVSPENTSILSYEGPPILTVQTCSGNWNEQRQMYTFKLIKAD
jgi:LPXTG-site transpeptidase (sortase) family protein